MGAGEAEVWSLEEPLAALRAIDQTDIVGVSRMGAGLAFGLVLPMFERPVEGAKPTWAEIRAMTEGAEVGFDTVWTADEIVWRIPEWPGRRGWRSPIEA